MPRRTPLTAALLAGAALALAPAGATAKPRTADVKVMTRNVFLGADLPPIALAAPGAPFEHAAGNLIREVKAGDPKARMRLIADEIAAKRPDLVGLQEVSHYLSGPKGDKRPATHTIVDFLAVIRRELARRHQSYRVAAKRYGFDVEGPSDRGVDVRLTLGDVILARKGVRTSHARTGVFADQLTIPSDALGPVSPGRTWTSVDATVRGARLHFVNTHLEAYDPGFRLKQAQELVAGPLRSGRQTVLVGDLNSGPTLAKPADRPPYEAIAAAGFKPRRTAKDSCCFDDLAKNAGWDHNVDWIMTKPGAKLVSSSITGREKTRSGLHPSDHGGVVSTLRLKR
jgi:endonuclease/exonuclease/phosphatase family metal-dependent hydrolase